MVRNQRKRLTDLERRVGSLTEVVTLYFADKSTVELKGRRNFLLGLFGRMYEVLDPCSEDARQLDLIGRSVASREPGGARLVELISALLNSPIKQADASEKPE